MKKGEYKWQYSIFITQYNLNQFNISLQTDEILPLAQHIHTSLCLCSQPVFPVMLNWLHVWQPCHLLWHLSRHFLRSLTSNLTSSASGRWKGSVFMSKGQRNAIKAVPFPDHPLWQTQLIMLQRWKAGNYQKWGAMLLISCSVASQGVPAGLAGVATGAAGPVRCLQCRGGMDTEKWEGGGKGNPHGSTSMLQ